MEHFKTRISSGRNTKQEISDMISESIMNTIKTTPSIADKLKSLGNNIVEAGKTTGKIITKPISAVINRTEEKLEKFYNSKTIL